MRPAETAEAHLCVGVPTALPCDTAEEMRRALLARPPDCADVVAVRDGERLAGLIRIEALLSAPAGAKAADLMDPDPPVVSPGADQEVAAWKAVVHGEGAVAVVDGEGAFLGVIPPQRLMEILLREHDEDMARLAGASAARHASEEPTLRRLAHRLPWLLAGLAVAMLSADVVGLFEPALRRHLAVAFFLPAIVYLADAVGTQTETLAVRGLSVGVPIRRFAAREVLTGIGVGIALAAVAAPLAWLRWGDARLAAALAVSLVAACSAATCVAMVLPWALARLGADPAFGSGPLATVIQDVLSIAIYLSTASALLS